MWWADLGLPRGSAPALRRPVVVIGDNSYNNSRLRTVTVVALTTTMRLAALPGNVAVPADVSGLDRDSVANVTQDTAIDREALESYVSDLPRWVMTQIDDGLRRALSL